MSRWKPLPTLALAVAAGFAGLAAPASAAPPRAAEYLGEWTYDQPDRGSMRNVAELSCLDTEPGCESPVPGQPPGTGLRIPQIGRIVFTRGADGRVVGRTDRGCTWTFAVRRTSLQLDPPAQTCGNRVIGSSYTITSWSVTVSGRHEKESIAGISHHGDDDYAFELAHGSRTRTRTEPWAKAAKRFAGRWTYDPADRAQMINMVAYREAGVLAERRGHVDMTVHRDRTITARTSDGCRWTLAARGNTAELDPPGQTCRRSGETVTLGFWQVTSDGRKQASIMNGTVRRAGSDSGFLMNIGALTRR